MVADFIGIVSEWIAGIVQFITEAFSGIIPIFYDAGTIELPGDGFTIYGILMLFSLAVGFVSLGLGWITRLLKK